MNDAHTPEFDGVAALPVDLDLEPDTLGPCGCVDEHEGDCSTRIGGGGGDVDDRGVDYAAEADYRAHSSSVTGVYEEGSATERVVVGVLLAMSAVVFAVVVLAWWAAPADATRVVPGVVERVDYCQNRAGTQTILDVTTGHRFRVVHVTPDGRRVCRRIVR